MSQAKPALVLAMALGAWGAIGRAQPLVSPPAPDAMLSTQLSDTAHL